MGRSGKGNKFATKKQFSRSQIKEVADHSFDMKSISKIDPEDGKDVFAALLSTLIDESAPVQRRLAAEMPTGLNTDYKKMFKTRSRIIAQIADDPRFADVLQVAVDLDSTLFPIDRAMRELGVDVPDTEKDAWGDDGDPVGDAIVQLKGRPELMHGKELTSEQEGEKIQLLIEYFEQLHGDPDLMKRAGVFEYGPQMLEEMRRQGITVHIVTHRSPESLDETEAWLDSMGVEYDDIICNHSHEVDKIQYCTDRGIPVILDDKPKTIIDAEAAGVEAVSLAWPYSAKALEEAGGDQAQCWREMAAHTISHIERLVLERAKELGIHLQTTTIKFQESSNIEKYIDNLAK
jgi:phosphoglycolate phosphatase-like HAD superfamily hydrolase